MVHITMLYIIGSRGEPGPCVLALLFCMRYATSRPSCMSTRSRGEGFVCYFSVVVLSTKIPKKPKPKKPKKPKPKKPKKPKPKKPKKPKPKKPKNQKNHYSGSLPVRVPRKWFFGFFGFGFFLVFLVLFFLFFLFFLVFLVLFFWFVCFFFIFSVFFWFCCFSYGAAYDS